MSKVLEFPVKKPAEPEPAPVDGKAGQALYSLYRQFRVEQGWEEWKWESLNITQQLVWIRLAERLGLQVPNLNGLS